MYTSVDVISLYSNLDPNYDPNIVILNYYYNGNRKGNNNGYE